MVKITLDAETFKALASATRLTVLRSLDQRRKTLSELSRDLELNKATLHEHLALLSAAGLVKKRDDEGRKWIYYELTWTGQKILHPQETTTFNVLLGAGVLAAGGGIAMLVRALGLWAQTKDFSAAEPVAAPTGPPGVLAGVAGDGRPQDLAVDGNWRNAGFANTSPQPDGDREDVSGAGGEGGGGPAPMASATSSAPPTTNAAPMPPASSPSYTPTASSPPPGTSTAPATSAPPMTSTAPPSAPPTTSYAPSGGGGGSAGGATYSSAPASPSPTMTQPPATSAPATYSTTQAPSYTSPAPAYTTSQAPPAATGTYPPPGQPPGAYAGDPVALGIAPNNNFVGAGNLNVVGEGQAMAAAPAEAPAPQSLWEEFAEDGGWLGLAMLACAALFTTLALLLRRRLRPEGSPLIGAGAAPGGDGDGEGEGDDEAPDGPATAGAGTPGSGDGATGPGSDAAPRDDGLKRS